MSLSDPIVVLASGHEGLCAAAWLSSLGRAVRVLFAGPIAAGPVEPVLAGEVGRLDPVLGPTRPTDARPTLLWKGQVVGVPRRRREIASLCGAGVVRLAGELWRADRRLPRDLGGWGERRLGRTGWHDVLKPLLAASLGGDPGPLHRGLGPLLACRPDGPWRAPARGARETIAAWIETVRATGGEVLDEVRITAVEIENGRVAAVMTDHGREHAATLVSDLDAPRMASLLPPDPLSDADPSALDYADEVHVELVAPNDLPPVVLSVNAARIRRALQDGGVLSPDRVWVTLAGAGFAALDDEAIGVVARGAVPSPIAVAARSAVVRVARGIPRPAPATEGLVFRWLRGLAALGVLPIGPRALYVPMFARDVVDTTVAVLDEVSPVAVRGGRLGLTPVRPWMLVQ